MNARVLMLAFSEGFQCNVRTVLHRVIAFKGKQYYSTRDLGVNYPYDNAKYFLENKWYPGFNDYPLGEDFEFYAQVETVSEWITGAFNVSEKGAPI
jgi:hypothetical protein